MALPLQENGVDPEAVAGELREKEAQLRQQAEQLATMEHMYTEMMAQVGWGPGAWCVVGVVRRVRCARGGWVQQQPPAARPLLDPAQPLPAALALQRRDGAVLVAAAAHWPAGLSSPRHP
jgi:hypothetical protein